MTNEEIEHTSFDWLENHFLKYYCQQLEQENEALRSDNLNVKDLLEENASQNAVLDILKPYIHISIDYEGDNPENICYLIIFAFDEGKTVIDKLTKAQYETLKEWLEE